MFIDKPPASHDKAVVLVSGGLDSAVALALARLNTCTTLLAISFDYGQPHQAKEREAAEALAAHYKAIPHRTRLYDLSPLIEDDWGVGLRTSGATEQFAEIAKDPPLLPKSWVPGRNIAFLNYAASYAWYHGAHIVVGGIHAEDQPGYPDCRKDFLYTMEVALQEGLGYTLSLWMPLLNMDKAQIVELGIRLKVPFGLTWSCYRGKEKPCGECDACIRRAKAFAANGIRDILLEGGKE